MPLWMLQFLNSKFAVLYKIIYSEN